MNFLVLRKCAVLAVILIAGCTAAPLVGDTPSSKPPQLIPTGQKDSLGGDLMTWDNPLAFGRIPSALKAAGDVACMLASVDLEAIGYHPRAKDPKGNEMPQGGYYCARKLNGDRPHPTPPQLTRADGILGWDRPGAFGAVPVDLIARGDKVCSTVGTGYIAIAYHPAAINENRQAIPGGGFFCAVGTRKNTK